MFDLKIHDLGDLNGKFLLINVGTEKSPATGEDILEIEKKLREIFIKNKINCNFLVTNHGVHAKVE